MVDTDLLWLQQVAGDLDVLAQRCHEREDRPMARELWLAANNIRTRIEFLNETIRTLEEKSHA